MQRHKLYACYKFMLWMEGRIEWARNERWENERIFTQLLRRETAEKCILYNNRLSPHQHTQTFPFTFQSHLPTLDKAIESNISGSGIYFPSSHTSRLDVLKNSNAQHVRRLAARREEKKFTKLKKSRKERILLKAEWKFSAERITRKKKRNTKKSQMRENIN